MSLAYALFGAPHYPTGEAPDDSWGQLAHYNDVHPAFDHHYRHGYLWTNTPMWCAQRAPSLPDESPYKRRRDDVTSPFMKKTVPLVPAQPASPPPAHILKAGMYMRTPHWRLSLILPTLWILHYLTKSCVGLAGLSVLAIARSASRSRTVGPISTC